MNNQNIKQVPKLRFTNNIGQSFPDWEEFKLSALAKLVTKKNRDKKVNAVFTNSATNGIVNQSDFFEKDIANRSNLGGYYVIKKGDYVYNPRVSNIAPVGPISKNKIGEGLISPLYIVFRFENNQNDFFEQYFITSHWYKNLRKVSNTGARFDRMSISPSIFMDIPVPYPSVDEQKKIADCLSSLDELINAHNNKLEALKEHKKGLMQNLFPAKGETKPKLRFKEFENDGGWRKEFLGKIASDITTGKLDANAMSENGEYRFYTCAKNYYRINEYAFDTEALLIAGNGAYLGYIHYFKGKFNAYQRTYVLSDFSKNVIYLKYFLERFLPQRISSEKKDGNTPYIVLSTITDMEICIPENTLEQQKIANCLSSLDEIIEEETKKIEALKEHKKGLMQGLFPKINNEI